MPSLDSLEALVLGRTQLRPVPIDGLLAAGKPTLARRLVEATGGACVQRDELVEPEALWRWRDRPSFPFDYVRYDAFLAAAEELAALHADLIPPYDLRIRVVCGAASMRQAVRARGMGAWAREWERMFLPSVEPYLRPKPWTRADVLVAGRTGIAMDAETACALGIATA